MTYAIVETGGKQYRVKEGDLLYVEKIPAEAGKKVDLGRVLFVSQGDRATVGRPVVEGASVEAEVVAQERGDKIVIFKHKRRKNYRKKQGHRQSLTRVRVTKIAAA
ncbi:MAG: 50S ribosomal protein L21 [Nitrospirae bacterium RBG_16_64_22]|nr:MAG: 50S ribosomal protein L21 [Nitrospirae bacterium RBG_16_64_22]